MFNALGLPSGVVANVARSALAFNAIGLNPILKIHPAIGIARVGDAPTAFFIGPERPFAGNTGQDSGVGSAVPSFRDGGQIKRQAARFRIFHYPTGKLPEELNLDHPEVAEIEWSVQLANRKAAFFLFEGQRGAAGPFTGPVQDRRNKGVPSASRDAKLVIDPGKKSIKGASAGPVKFDSSSGNWPKNSVGAPVIDYLGELRTDSKGRLLVLGGHGKSASSVTPPAPLLKYANNDTWFDDISDGPVTARVKLKSGKTVTVQAPAWVLVGPPDFAPEIRSVVSLYDTILDVAIRELPDPTPPFYTPPDLARFKSLKASFIGTPGFQPEWFADIEPTIQAGFHARFVHEPAHSVHTTLAMPDLKNPAASALGMRQVIFNFLRPPAGNTVYSSAPAMPKLFGDKYFDPGDPKRVLAVTQLQYHILTLWKDGKFLVGGGGPSPTITPEGLDRAALESCVGGAFFPGIECSWLVRDKRLYSEPFRIQHGASVGPLTVGPGFFSQQMALPWQADFMDCAKDDGTVGVFFGWWPAQRPDDVYKSAADATAGTGMVPWARGLEPPPPPPPPPPGAMHANMVALWKKLGFVISITVGGNKVFVESERTLP